MPPISGSGMRKPNSARLGIVCARFASANQRPRQHRAAAPRGCRAGCRWRRRSRSRRRPARCARRAERRARRDARRGTRGARSSESRLDQRAHDADRRLASARRGCRRRRSGLRAARDAIGQRKRLGQIVGDEQHRRGSFACSASELACSSTRVIGSSAPNGSSISSTGGSAASARARPTRCRWPPDSSSGQRSRNSPARDRPGPAARRRARPTRVGRPLQQPRHERDVLRNGEVREEADVLNGVAGLPPQRDLVPLGHAAPGRPAPRPRRHAACG